MHDTLKKHTCPHTIQHFCDMQAQNNLACDLLFNKGDLTIKGTLENILRQF